MRRVTRFVTWASDPALGWGRSVFGTWDPLQLCWTIGRNLDKENPPPTLQIKVSRWDILSPLPSTQVGLSCYC